MRAQAPTQPEEHTGPGSPLPDESASGQSLPGALTDGEVSGADLARLWAELGLPLVKALILIVVVLLVAGWARRVVVRISTRARVETTLARFFGNAARWGLLLLGAIAILQTFGVDTTSFAAVVAALGFAIGLALSGTLGNFAAGIMLLIFRPFKVGDYITAAGVSGTVDEIELFTTSLDTPDKRRIIIPNGSIFGSTIENVTFHPVRRCDIDVGTAYGADIDRTREVLMEAARKAEGRVPDEEPVIYLKQMGASSIDWQVRVWVPTPDLWPIRDRLTRDIKVALDEAGIPIPFPQMDVHLDRAEP